MQSVDEIVGRDQRRQGSVRIAFLVFIATELVLISATIWDLGRFTGSGAAIPGQSAADTASIETARVAGWMLLATLGQLVVATVGFWFIVRTLRASEAAVIVAATSIDLQQKASADQFRAYVHAAAAEIEWDAARRRCRVQFAFANTGQTPATYFEFGAGFVEVPHGARAKELPIVVPETFTRWSPIGSGDRVTAAWYEDRLAERLSAYTGSDERSGGVILISGVVRYGTIFAETFESDFAFFLPSAPSPEGRPLKLSRSTNAFRAYQRVENVSVRDQA